MIEAAAATPIYASVDCMKQRPININYRSLYVVIFYLNHTMIDMGDYSYAILLTDFPKF